MHIDNHFVPKSYLKNWEDSENKIYAYRTLVSHENVPLWKPVTATGVAYHQHLYTRIIDGEQSDEIERWLDSKYESPAKEIIQKVINGKRIKSTDWGILIRFLALQDVRTPARLIEYLNRAKEILPKILQDTLDNLVKDIETGSIRPHIANNSITIGKELPLKISTKIDDDHGTGTLKAQSYIGRSTWISSLKHTLENTADVLHKNKWTIVKPHKGLTWFTSDNPVVRLNYYKDGTYDLRGGWGREGCNIMLPLGPNHLLFTQVGDRPINKCTRLSSSLTQLIRKILAENAHRMIFTGRIDQDIESLRPRVVNEKAFYDEKNQWLHWHEQQSEKESEYFNSKQ